MKEDTNQGLSVGAVKEEEIQIACVLKSGGDYTIEYVEKFVGMVNRHFEHPYKILCYTDLSYDVGDLPCDFIRLVRDLPGWWSKLEVFRSIGPTIYMDLDTVILDDISHLADIVDVCPEDVLYMLKPFNPNREFASGVMMWNGDWQWVFNQFNRSYMKKDEDQVYIYQAVQATLCEIRQIQTEFSGIYSYKHHCMRERRRGIMKEINSPPEGARIISFHGEPRPHEVKEKWVLKNWK